MLDATLILDRIAAGDPKASDDLLPLVYDQLRALAGSFFRGQPANITLEPTALVHEAYLKLVRAAEAGRWESRAHFMAVAATAMRQILQDRARRRRAVKHGGQAERVNLSNVTPATEHTPDIVDLDEALQKLASLSERQHRIVELRFFGGLNNEEIAHVLKSSVSTVEKEWVRARAWLSAELAETHS